MTVGMVFRNQWVRAVGLLLALGLLSLTCYLLSPVLVPLIFSFLVAYILNPVVDFLEKRRIPRVVTIGFLAFLGVVLVLTIPMIFFQNLITEADQLIRIAAEKTAGGAIPEKVEKWVEKLPLEGLVRTLGWVDPSVEDFDPLAVIVLRVVSYLRDNALEFLRTHVPQFATAGQRASAVVFGTFASLWRNTVGFLLAVGNIVLFCIMTAYLLNDFHRIVEAFKEITPPRYRPKTFDIMGKIDQQVRNFMRGQLIVCLLLAAMYGTGLVLSGTPFAFPIAILSFAASFVPYCGPVVTLVPAFILTLLEYGVDWHIGGVLATVSIAQLFESNVITPKIMGKQVGLNPVWVILAILVFARVLGFVGLLIAVPTAAALKVLVVEAVDYYKRSSLFAGEAAAIADDISETEPSADDR